MYGCAEVSAVDTYILKALLHILTGALPSPGSVSLAADFGTWLELHQCRESWETDHSHQHRTVTGRSYQVLFYLFLLFCKLPGKTGMEIKRAAN